MSMERREANQGSMWVAYNEIQGEPGHRFYEKLDVDPSPRGLTFACISLATSRGSSLR